VSVMVVAAGGYMVLQIRIGHDTGRGVYSSVLDGGDGVGDGSGNDVSASNDMVLGAVAVVMIY